jgi:hypothetical protein
MSVSIFLNSFRPRIVAYWEFEPLETKYNLVLNLWKELIPSLTTLRIFWLRY